MRLVSKWWGNSRSSASENTTYVPRLCCIAVLRAADNLRIATCHFRRMIRCAVVYNDQFIMRMCLRQDAHDGFAEKVPLPIARNDHADEFRRHRLITKQVHIHGTICGSLTYQDLADT